MWYLQTGTMETVAVLGAGAWGTALSLLLSQEGQRVSLWTWMESHAKALREAQENAEFLPGFPLADTIHVTSNMEEALQGVELVVLVVPSHGFRDVLRAAKPWLAERLVVTATKGIEADRLMLMGEVIEDELGSASQNRWACLSGPSFAQEVASRLPTNVVVAARNAELCERVQQRFASDRFRVYSSRDPVGVEVGGALKNVVAIAAGACDGLGFGHNTRAAVITRGLSELGRLAEAKGGDRATLAGLSGMGDLVLTCTGDLSRNRRVGLEVGRGKSLAEVVAGLGHVAEGVRTAETAFLLAAQLGVELPICREVYRVLYQGKSPADAVRDVLARPLKPELC